MPCHYPHDHPFQPRLGVIPPRPLVQNGDAKTRPGVAARTSQPIAALRCAQPASAYLALRAKEKAEREAAAAEQDVRRYADALSNTHTAERLAPEAPEQATQEPTLRERTLTAKKVRAKLAKATRSKVAADKANKASAEAWAAKRVGQLEREGKL